jgi:aspartyl-tRNA(Asn)/glutamyl-tRNA(Gln) amidotransferase subunit A
MTDITSLSLTSLVDKVKKKELSSQEITKSFIERSEKSKKLNAYISNNFENALNKAKQFDEKPNLDLKLPGIPIGG